MVCLKYLVTLVAWISRLLINKERGCENLLKLMNSMERKAFFLIYTTVEQWRSYFLKFNFKSNCCTRAVNFNCSNV